jgi:hypothetical protein
MIKRPVYRKKQQKEQTAKAPKIVSMKRDDLEQLVDMLVDAKVNAIHAMNGPKEPPRFKRIEHHIDQQLNDAINFAVANVKDFWKILHGVDAYIERRKRRDKAISGWRTPSFDHRQS